MLAVGDIQCQVVIAVPSLVSSLTQLLRTAPLLHPQVVPVFFRKLANRTRSRSFCLLIPHPSCLEFFDSSLLMRLLHIGDLGLAEFVGDGIPPYAILSHTWGADHDEVTFKDMVDGTGGAKAGYRKIRFCEKQAAKDGLQFFWVDTCCIDKSSSMELTEAINSMFRWYQDAARCYVHLSDVSVSASDGDDEFSRRWKPAFKKSRWFTRGWTLQELIAPVLVEFFSAEGEWLGDKKSLEQTLHEITGIATQALRGDPLSYFGTDERMSWAAKRQTKREEDAAYSLLGIFNIYMPLIYGEGRQKALSRLRKEIKDDSSINLPIAKGSSFDSHAEEHNARRLRNTRAELATAPQAAFNALGKDNDPQCLPNTRVQVLQRIRMWADGDDGRYIFWLNGWAGTGKSTIARTIAREYYDKGCLIASFFFSRGGGDVSHAGKFVGTIATQLAQRCITFESILDKAISNDTGICGRTLKDQWNELVLQPLSKLEADSFQSPLLIVIDALDECEKESDVRMVLQLLSDLRRLGRLHSRVLITSRPDIPVRHGFSLVPDQDHQDFVLHDISRTIVSSDILTYLQHTLTDIGRKCTFDKGWPGDEAIRHLVQKAAGLFIWAATACRFIDEGGASFGSDRLSDILEGDSSDIEPEEELNIIYTKVLGNSISAHLKQREKDKAYLVLRRALEAIIILFSPLPTHSLAQLLHTPEQKIGAILGGLYSILDVPKDPTQPVRLHHPSLRDFLLSPHRCRNPHFWVDEKNAHETLADHCIRLMSQKLNKRDLCGLGNPGIKVAEVPPEKIQYYLPPELRYACRYWIRHLQRSGVKAYFDDDGLVHVFMQQHLLYWFETLSLAGKVSEGIHAIQLLEDLVDASRNPRFYAFIHDAKRFLLYNRSIIEEAPLQTYCSALLFSPIESVVRRQFGNHIPSWICKKPRVQTKWNAVLQVLEGHLGHVSSVAFSPDGKLVASGSLDKTVRLWDAGTGARLQTLKGHLGWISSVAFSPDGKLVVSGSGDKTVRLWDVGTGAQLQTLKGHSSGVCSVAFSPDGKLVVSGSGDKTVGLWDVVTGAQLQTLEGHSSEVYSVAFSPNGKLVASGSYDKTVRLWDAGTGAQLQTLNGHSGWVSSVAFSPNGKLVASGSYDETVRLWDTDTGAQLQTLGGHLGWVSSVAFSPDGKLVASGSYDETVSLWDTGTGAELQTLEGHSSRVYSVAFSPDGKLVVSGSGDKTVRLWDTGTGTQLQTLEGHSSSVLSVAFSPDGKLVASGTDDKTVRLWDTGTGAQLQTLKGHLGWVSSVAFSPNGKLVASGTDDKTVRLWDTGTGAQLQTLKGHSGWVSSVAFSPNGKLVVSGSGDKTVRLWDTGTGAQLQTLKGHSGWVSSVAFSPDGKLVASGSYDETVRLWDTGTGAQLQILEGHSSCIYSVAFSPNGKLVVSGSGDKTVRLWDAGTGAQLQMLDLGVETRALSFSPSGRYLKTDRGVLCMSSPELFTNSPEQMRSLFVQDDWVIEEGEGILWLPPAYRSTCVATWNGMFVLRHPSGGISFLEFEEGPKTL